MRVTMLYARIVAVGSMLVSCGAGESGQSEGVGSSNDAHLGEAEAVGQAQDVPAHQTAVAAVDPTQRTAEPKGEVIDPTWSDPMSAMPPSMALNAQVCAHAGDDLVRDLFCRDGQPIKPAGIHALVDLERALGVSPESVGGATAVVFTSHSTALSTRSVSAINPRVLLLQFERDGHELLALGFTRGEQLIELIVRDRSDQKLRFYVIGYQQACNTSSAGCAPADLLTPETERSWSELTLYDEATLTNTILDCAPCHQPDGPGTPKLLRMQELESPWTHWLFNGTVGGSALLDDYFAAHGDELLAGLPAQRIEYSNPGSLTTLLRAAPDQPPQPNIFNSRAIEEEVQQSAAAQGGMQPVDNSIVGESAAWRAAYEVSKRGDAIPVPYPNVKITDPEKLVRMTEAYAAYRRGELAPADLPDIREVFPDDPLRLSMMGIMTEPGLSGEQVLIQACSQCHNPRLDQSLTRARFRADLSGMDREARERAIERIQLPPTDPLAMPPARLRVLSREAITAAIEALRR